VSGDGVVDLISSTEVFHFTEQHFKGIGALKYFDERENQ
jgi:hypothetical protein